VGEGPFKSALQLLTDERSSFMTGAEVVLDRGGPARFDAVTDLSGKAVLVTGATSGIGRATAIEIGARGGFAAIGGRKLHLAEETLAMVRAAGGDGMVVPLDVTDARAWHDGVAVVLNARGALHGLVNNAGESKNQRIDELPAETVAFLLRINYEGALLGMRAALPALEASGGGAIINIASVAGVRAGPGGSGYGGSKAALIGASQSWGRALEGKSPRIRINALQPGLIWSDSVADSLGEEGARTFRAFIEPKTPIGRVGRPEEIAAVIAYLLSDPASPINAQAINVSGGLELNFP
jgi:NAD(P)-dependent dehydrogenase (short-subunit alcohol dehydrogenase family)